MITCKKNNKQKLICPQCNKIFSRVDNKNRHLRTSCKGNITNNKKYYVNKNKNNMCIECNKYVQNLDTHLRLVHINPILFKDI